MSIEELLQTLRRKGIPLQFEIGTFVALEVCETISSRPVALRAEEVCVDEQGQVSVMVPDTGASEERAARALVDLLGELLSASAPAVPDALLQLVENGPGDGQWNLVRLRDELEASLIPVNRQATQRVLSRLVREAGRGQVRPDARALATPDADQLDREFDELLGGSVRGKDPSAASPSPDALLTAQAATARGSGPRPQAGFEASAHPAGQVDEFAGLEEAAAPGRWRQRRALLVALAGLAMVSLAVLAVLAYRNQYSASVARSPAAVSPDSAKPPKPRARPLAGEVARAPKAVEAAAAAGRAQSLAATEQAAANRRPADVGTLTVNSAPSRAQVFLFVGHSPVQVEPLPLGMAHEFLSIGPHRLLSRAVVPADAVWQQGTRGQGGAFYELSMPAGRASGAGVHLDLGPTELPHDVGAPSGRFGTVRISTKLAGAKVYQLVGFTPDLQVENLSIKGASEFLLFAAGYRVETVKVEPSRWTVGPDGPTAAIDVSLHPSSARK